MIVPAEVFIIAGWRADNSCRLNEIKRQNFRAVVVGFWMLGTLSSLEVEHKACAILTRRENRVK